MLLRARSPLPPRPGVAGSTITAVPLLKSLQKGKMRHGTPLPALQLAVLMGVRLAEPSESASVTILIQVAYTVIFPFVNEYVSMIGVTDNPDRVGFYSGLVESCFSLVQMLTVYQWSTLSDQFGRRPVILIGLVGVAISGALFGLSTSFWMMLLTRCLSGALNGNVAVIKASLGDITDAEAFAVYGLTWIVGSILGSALGGIASHPAERFPKYFGRFDILKRHPFFLPCLISASCTVLGLLFAFFFYEESLPAIVNRRSRRSSSLSSEATLVEESLLNQDSVKLWGFWDLWALKSIKIMGLSLFLNTFVGGAWAAVSLLFFYTPVERGGLGMPASSIGTALAFNGIWAVVCQLLFLKRIRHRFGVILSYQLLNGGWVLAWPFVPLLHKVVLATESPDAYGHYSKTRGRWLWLALAVQLGFTTIVGMASSLQMVIVNLAAPDRNSFGAVNGLSTSIGCLARVLGPASISALFALSIDLQVLHGHLWWIFMTLTSIISIGASMLHPDDRALKPVVELDEVWEFEVTHKPAAGSDV